MTTVTEELARPKRIIRCRLNATWSLLARIAFWSACGIELLLIGWLARAHPWVWMLLLTMSLFGGFGLPNQIGTTDYATPQIPGRL